jgi:subtilisin family serine protease
MKLVYDFRVSASALGRCALVAGLTITLFACRDAVAPHTPSDNPAALGPVSQARGDQKIKDEYIVIFRSNVRDVLSEVSDLASRHSLTPRHFYKSGIKGFSGHMTAEVARAVAEDPDVAYVEQNGVVSITDTQTSAIWGLDRIDQASLPLSTTYTYTETGAGVNVYIIDTGIRTTHTQFQGRAVGDFTSILDGNGPGGCHWHGTHVAGTVGGWAVGVAKAVTLHSVRVLDCTGNGSDADVIAGIDWVTANAVKPAVANMSIGGPLSVAMNDAIQRSIASGVTYVVAAGNDASDACNVSPASAPDVITVGATKSTDVQASFSNWGTCLDIYAPGYDIFSALDYNDTAIGSASGTSMASPHVAGAAALYLETHPLALPAEVADAIASSATAGILTSLGPGSPNRLLRVNGSVEPAPAPPPAPAPVTPDAPPTADFSFKCQTRKCTFDARNSKDDRGIVSFVWSFGDGTAQTTSTIATAAHDYAVKGKYLVTLKVVDTAGQSATRTKSVDSH